MGGSFFCLVGTPVVFRGFKRIVRVMIRKTTGTGVMWQMRVSLFRGPPNMAGFLFGSLSKPTQEICHVVPVGVCQLSLIPSRHHHLVGRFFLFVRWVFKGWTRNQVRATQQSLKSTGRFPVT